MVYAPILATLGYVFSTDANQVLMVHRNKRPDDLHFGKYNGLGGKLERGEDVVSGLKREIREESGLICDTVSLCGTVNWPGFGKHGEDWFGFIFRITEWHGEISWKNPEGTLEWVNVDQIMDLPLWEGDRHFLPLVLSVDGPPFHGVMPYQEGRPVGWQCSIIDNESAD